MRTRLSRLCFLAAFSLPATAQSVWTVDDDAGPGVDFTTVQAAYDAAQDGDVILVRDGEYKEILSFERGISIVMHADQGQRPTLGPGPAPSLPTISIRNLPVGKELYVRGFDVKTAAGFGFQGLLGTIVDNAGEVWIEDCGFSVNDYSRGVSLRNNAGVHFSRCDVYSDWNWIDAMSAVDTDLTLWDCVLSGSNAGTNVLRNPTSGGHGLELSGGVVFASGCSFLGGDSTHGGNGGSGIWLENGALARTRDCTFSAGDGSTGTHYVTGVTTVGVDGMAISLDQGTGSVHEAVTGTRRGFTMDSPLRSGVDPVRHSYTGEPGDFVYLLWSTSGQIPGFYLAFEHGSFVIDLATLDGVALGTLDATGTLDVIDPPVSIGLLSTFSFACQASFFRAGEGFFLSAPSLATVVSAP